MAIVDNRTLLSGFDTGDTVTQPDDLSGAAGGTADTEIFIQGARSWGYYSGSTRAGLMYDAGAAQDWSGNTFYIWVNCGVAGLLDTAANGGLAVRFAGAAATDWFESNLAGSDSYPAAVQGGWVMFVVDIEKAKLASDRTGGTPPATTAVRYVGISTITSTMPRMADNTWLDAIWRLPAATPGILVEGQNTGSVDWTWADIAAAAEAGAWGTAKVTAGGAIAINTPIRFGANDAATHGFADENAVVLWEDWDVGTSFYGLEVVGGTGTQSFQLGLKSGTGDSATGAQGGAISAASSGERWFFDCDDANVDACGIYGVTMQHAGALDFDGANVEVISSIMADCGSADVTGSAAFLDNTVVNANTADGAAFVTAASMDEIVFCSFEFSDGHGVEITGGAASQASKGNRFSGYGASTTNDAAIFNNTGAARTITLSDGATLAEHTVRDGASASTNIVAGAVTLELTASNIVTGAPVQNARVVVYAAPGGAMPADASVSITRTGTTATVTHASHGMSTNALVVVRGCNEGAYNGVHVITVTGASTYTYAVKGAPATPATGAPLASEGIISALTSASGQVSDTRSYGSDQPIRGFVRKGSTAPTYKTSPLAGNIVDSATGRSIAVPMTED